MPSEKKTSKYFIKTSTEGAEPSLVLFDERGNPSSENRLLGENTEILLSIFNGLPKAVHRSSGGLILVQPSQLVLTDSSEGIMDLRIKVLFKELERNSQHQIVSKKIITSSKTVPLSEIKEGFTYDNIRFQNFVLDMGLGIVPVHVLSFYPDSQGHLWALFVRHDELEKSLVGFESRNISIYEVPQNLLRSIESLSHGEKDFQWAKGHVRKLVERGETIIPELLLIGSSVEVPTGLSFTGLEHHLLSCIEKKLLTPDVSYFIPSTETHEQSSLVLLDENPD
jgi:hypothetical protein